MSQVEIIVLANSVKHNQHCVAGKLLDNSQWVRPVSNAQGGELSDEQARIQNPHGVFYVKPLQKIYMGLSSHAPLINQPENYITDNTNQVQYDFAVTDPNFDRLIQNPAELEGILCVSLGEEYQGNCFKLIATIF